GSHGGGGLACARETPVGEPVRADQAGLADEPRVVRRAIAPLRVNRPDQLRLVGGRAGDDRRPRKPSGRGGVEVALDRILTCGPGRWLAVGVLGAVLMPTDVTQNDGHAKDDGHQGNHGPIEPIPAKGGSGWWSGHVPVSGDLGRGTPADGGPAPIRSATDNVAHADSRRPACYQKMRLPQAYPRVERVCWRAPRSPVDSVWPSTENR